MKLTINLLRSHFKFPTTMGIWEKSNIAGIVSGRHPPHSREAPGVKKFISRYRERNRYNCWSEVQAKLNFSNCNCFMDGRYPS
jgi:hypothetical protein